MAKYTAKLLDAIESFPDHLLELARDVETVRQRLSEAMGSSGFDVSFGRTAKDLASSAVLVLDRGVREYDLNGINPGHLRSR